MPDFLDIQLINKSDSDQVWAYVTGVAIKQQGKRCLLKANGRDLYFPPNPPKVGSPLAEDCAIPLNKRGGPPKVVHIPQIAGGRIWFCRGKKLTFVLNPGNPSPALVEPSVLNAGDPNHDVDFAFAEFTLNRDQLYANISYVDFCPRLPVALTLKQKSGRQQHVSGMKPDGLDRIAADMRAQSQHDHRPWDKLIVQPKGQSHPLRVLNPTHAGSVGANFAGYYEPYIDRVWQKYHSGSPQCKINTQAQAGVVSGHSEGGQFVFGGEKFAKPNTADVFGCNTGPFTTGGSPARNAIIPRLAAALIRSSLLDQPNQPSDPKTFYKTDPTNHYCRIVHKHNADGKGYAFAYDDVQPDGGEDQSGKVNAGDPDAFIITVGGGGA